MKEIVKDKKRIYALCRTLRKGDYLIITLDDKSKIKMYYQNHGKEFLTGRDKDNNVIKVNITYIDAVTINLKKKAPVAYPVNNNFLSILFKALVIVVFFAIVCKILSIPFEHNKYSSENDMEVIHSSEKNVTKLDILDKYTKNGVTYYEFNTSQTGLYDIYTFSEKEYNAVFGEGNTAFDMETYALSINAFITKDIYFSYLAAMHKIPWKKKSSDTYMLSHKIDENAVIKVYYDTSKGDTTAKLEITRYNFLGETDFTEEEIENYKKEFDSVCRDILRMAEGEESKLAWQ